MCALPYLHYILTVTFRDEKLQALASGYSKVVIKTKYAHLMGDRPLPSQLIITIRWMVSNDT